MSDYEIHTTTATSWGGLLCKLRNILYPNQASLGDDVSKKPGTLVQQVGPICAKMLTKLHYTGAPQLEEESVEALLECMYERAVEIGVPLDTPLSSKGFRLGFVLALVAHPRHPVEVQIYIGIFTWLVVQYDDIVGQNNEMVEEAMQFNECFSQGKTQPNKLLEGIANLLREAYAHFDPILANMLQISTLKFLTSNLLERHSGFQNMVMERTGNQFSDFCRELSGCSIAYAIFSYPKVLYPDVGAFLQALPDMAHWINMSNDVLSFYKEELGGETRNYLHIRALNEGKPILQVLSDVNEEAIEAAQRASKILQGRGIYEHSWREKIVGMTAMHTTSPRYMMEDLGLGEEHPLAPYEHKIGHFFESKSNASSG